MADAVAPQRTFEQAFAELEARVRDLERGDLPLEEALALFESGVRLQGECQSLLDAAEHRIIELSESSQQGEEAPPS